MIEERSDQELSDREASGRITLWRAIWVGQLVIVLPQLIIGGFALFVLLSISEWLALSVGLGLAILWWSIVAPRWRAWALQSGVDPKRLYRWGFLTGITFPKDSLPEKAEIHLSDRTFFGLMGFLLVAAFLTSETLLSEFFESRFTLPGSLGPIVAAGISGALVLPVHRGLSRLVRRAKEEALRPPEPSNDASDPDARGTVTKRDNGPA